ncbi:hypothetical protein Salat_2960500 [Sesamum alatum]|uniref:Uncharacterized protein n=1 Tax=Sesamum alatum TaxID=300844 RepID=A0AAE2C7S2_9LAMI|nr:hypothetical protein Salat_2960500 [Sesamum alatum]
MGVLDPCSGSDDIPCKPLQLSAQVPSCLGRSRFPVLIPIEKASTNCPERPVSALRCASRGRGAGWTSKHPLCPTSRARSNVLGLLAHCVVARSLGCGITRWV